MKQQTIVIAIAILVVIVAGMFTFAYLKKNELQNTTPITATSTKQQASTSNAYASITRITAKHYFIDGVHTFAGEIQMPTPCDLVEATTTVVDAQVPAHVSLDFNVINNSDTCEQTVTDQRFKVSYEGDASTTFSARFMGRDVELNLIPALPGEKPEDFQLYQKG